MKPPTDKGIHGKARLQFEDNEQLRRYYEEKYATGGYEDGYVMRGVKISERYHERRRQVALGFMQPARPDVILDAGCGSGTLAASMAETGSDVHAIDIAANALEPRYRAIPNLHFQPMNVETLGFPDAFFDKVVCIETLEHVLSPEKALREFFRVLKQGGQLVITYPTINRTTVKRWHLGRRLEVSEHLTEWSFAELVARIEQLGFKVERTEGISFDFGALLIFKALSHFLAERITALSLSIRRYPGNSLFVCIQARKGKLAEGI